MAPDKTRYPLFAREDLDGFFGLFVDNLVQLLLIAALCSGLCGMTGDEAWFLYGAILPGAALSVLAGNLFYAWQARRLARRECRNDVTALPYGINTPSLLVYIFFVMAPVYRETGSARAAWEMGLIACVGSGLIEFGGAFVADYVRRHTPRAALLSSLSGIAIGFIAMAFMLQIWQYPVIAVAPLALVLYSYLTGRRIGGIPGGFAAIVLGSAIAWLLPPSLSGISISLSAAEAEAKNIALYLPSLIGVEGLGSALTHNGVNWAIYLSVIIPMGLFNVLGSLQNIESAAAAGDNFAPRSSLVVNGIGTLAAACFGSCFPTTIYIGHPGWKALGARSGYSVLNGLIVALICLSGSVLFVARLIPLEACVAIVLWIGLIITAQAFAASPARHAPAVALGLFPAIAAWGAVVVAGTFEAIDQAGGSGATMQTLLTQNLQMQAGGFLIHGMNLLHQGYIFTCMFLAAVAAALTDRRFLTAASWCALAALLTLLGVMHAYQLVGNSIHFLMPWGKVLPGAAVFPATGIAVGYVLAALVFLAAHFFGDKKDFSSEQLHAL